MFIQLTDHMGSDLSVANAARVSFEKESQLDQDGLLKLSDRELIHYLARGMKKKEYEEFLYLVVACQTKEDAARLLRDYRGTSTHWSPFTHTSISLRCEAPIFVTRQVSKHTVGANWNEVSRRYVTTKPSFHEITEWRKSADDVKQGSSEELVDEIETGYPITEYVKNIHKVAEQDYEVLLGAGVCAEQARTVLPLSSNTQWIWTGNVYFFHNVYKQRSKSDAQKESRDFAKKLREVVEPLFPVSWEALSAY